MDERRMVVGEKHRWKDATYDREREVLSSESAASGMGISVRERPVFVDLWLL
jgi:hypothetical protein